MREKAVTVIPSPPIDPPGIFTGPTGDFAGPTWGSDGLWDAKGELGRSCRHPLVRHWFLNPNLWVAGKGSDGDPPLPVDLLRVYAGSSLSSVILSQTSLDPLTCQCQMLHRQAHVYE